MPRCGFFFPEMHLLHDQFMQAQAAVVGRFRTGEINLLLATNIGSEGMNFQRCELVVAFEPPSDVTSYIQVRCPAVFYLPCSLCQGHRSCQHCAELGDYAVLCGACHGFQITHW
jgi:hypothetical protein